jgi:hypothetical protein
MTLDFAIAAPVIARSVLVRRSSKSEGGSDEAIQNFRKVRWIASLRSQ